jgi:hypothetical protein
VKLTISIDLLDAGYSFIFMDGDVYLTGSRNPFDQMLSSSDDTWDIQFQKDYELPNTDLNIGWFFAKPTEATKEFFDRSYKQWSWTRAWDQQVMNDVAKQMESRLTLRVHRLDLSRFRNYMLEDHEANLFGAEAKIAEWIDASVLVHMTCIEQDLKTYYGATFGGFANFDGFYSSPSSVIGVANITGTSTAILHQVAFAMKLAQDTSRALIWPHRVHIIQRRPEQNGWWGGSGITHLSRTNFPGVRAVNYALAQKIGVALLESRFLPNRRHNVPNSTLQASSIGIKAHVSSISAEHASAGIQRLKHVIQHQPENTVPVLDFDDFEPSNSPWLRPNDVQESIRYEITNPGYKEHVEQTFTLFEEMLSRTGISSYSEDMLVLLKTCRNVEMEVGCLNVCE